LKDKKEEDPNVVVNFENWLSFERNIDKLKEKIYIEDEDELNSSNSLKIKIAKNEQTQ
jgi:hypothetical protein